MALYFTTDYYLIITQTHKRSVVHFTLEWLFMSVFPVIVVSGQFRLGWRLCLCVCVCDASHNDDRICLHTHRLPSSVCSGSYRLGWRRCPVHSRKWAPAHKHYSLCLLWCGLSSPALRSLSFGVMSSPTLRSLSFVVRLVFTPHYALCLLVPCHHPHYALCISWCHVITPTVCMVPRHHPHGVHGAKSSPPRCAWCHVITPTVCTVPCQHPHGVHGATSSPPQCAMLSFAKRTPHVRHVGQVHGVPLPLLPAFPLNYMHVLSDNVCFAAVLFLLNSSVCIHQYIETARRLSLSF